jgi:hypothetical protein
VLNFLYRWFTFHVFLQVAEFFYNDRILGQAGRKIGESVGSISRGPTPGSYDPPECNPGQQAYTFLIRILSTSFISVSIFSVCCYSMVYISMLFPPSPLPCVNKYSAYKYIYIQCVRGGGVWGHRMIGGEGASGR